MLHPGCFVHLHRLSAEALEYLNRRSHKRLHLHHQGLLEVEGLHFSNLELQFPLRSLEWDFSLLRLRNLELVSKLIHRLLNLDRLCLNPQVLTLFTLPRREVWREQRLLLLTCKVALPVCRECKVWRRNQR